MMTEPNPRVTKEECNEKAEGEQHAAIKGEAEAVPAIPAGLVLHLKDKVEQAFAKAWRFLTHLKLFIAPDFVCFHLNTGKMGLRQVTSTMHIGEALMKWYPFDKSGRIKFAKAIPVKSSVCAKIKILHALQLSQGDLRMPVGAGRGVQDHSARVHQLRARIKQGGLLAQPLDGGLFQGLQVRWECCKLPVTTLDWP